MCASERASRPRLVLVSGFDQSGKSSVANMLFDRGFRTIECGELAREMLGTVRGASLTELYQKNIEAVDRRIARYVVFEASRNCYRDRLCVVGIRSVGLFVSVLEHLCCEVESVFVDASFEVRFARHCKDSRIQQHLSQSDFAANDAIQVGWGILKVRNLCDHHVNNNGDMSFLKQSIGLIAERE